MKTEGATFQKHHEKKGGRKKGTLNKATVSNRILIQSFVDDHWDEVEDDIWKMLSPKEKSEFFLQMLHLVCPKPVSVDVRQENKIDTSSLDVLRRLCNDDNII